MPVPVNEIKKVLRQIGYVPVDKSEVEGLSGEGLEKVLEKAAEEKSQG